MDNSVITYSFQLLPEHDFALKAPLSTGSLYLSPSLVIFVLAVLPSLVEGLHCPCLSPAIVLSPFPSQSMGKFLLLFLVSPPSPFGQMPIPALGGQWTSGPCP